jgi:hypothetical protein
MADFDGMVTALEALADFAKWSHSGDKPDLPEGHAASPSMSSAAATLGFGIQKLEILNNLQLPKIKRKKALLTAAIFKKLDGKALLTEASVSALRIELASSMSESTPSPTAASTSSGVDAAGFKE